MALGEKPNKQPIQKKEINPTKLILSSSEIEKVQCTVYLPELIDKAVDFHCMKTKKKRSTAITEALEQYLQKEIKILESLEM